MTGTNTHIKDPAVSPESQAYHKTRNQVKSQRLMFFIYAGVHHL